MIHHTRAYLLLFLFLCGIIGTWFIGLALDLQYYYRWFDIFLHMGGGMWTAAFLGIFFKTHHTFATGPWSFFMAFFAIVGGALLVGIFWEFIEFFADRVIIGSGFSYFSGAVEDTLSDLWFDFVGATMGYLLINNKI